MKRGKNNVWKKSKGDLLVFNFCPPEYWDELRLAEENMKISTQLKNVEDISSIETEEWLKVIKKLPSELIDILVLELCSGNSIDYICFYDWPNKGSVVVSMKKQFSEKSKKYSEEISFSKLNEPRSYCSEEILQIKNGVKHLLIH
jgi:hypothetical protein